MILTDFKEIFILISISKGGKKSIQWYLGDKQIYFEFIVMGCSPQKLRPK